MGTKIINSALTLPQSVRDKAVISPFYASGLQTGLLSGRIFNKDKNNLEFMPGQPVNFQSTTEQGVPMMATAGPGVNLDFISYLRLDTAEPLEISGMHVFRTKQDGTHSIETARIVDTLTTRATGAVDGFSIAYQQFTSTNTTRINYIFNGQENGQFNQIVGNVMSDTPKIDTAWRAIAYSINPTANTITFWDLDGYNPAGTLTPIVINAGTRSLANRNRGNHIIYGSTLETVVSAVGELQLTGAFTWNRVLTTAEVQAQWLVLQKQLLGLGLSIGIQPV